MSNNANSANNTGSNISSNISTFPAPLIIDGGQPTNGSLEIFAAKNAVLPIIGACLLSSEPITLHRVPRISDVEVILQIIASFGARSEWTGPHSLTIHTPTIIGTDAPEQLVTKMRASFEVFGPLLARAGEARIATPGGCVIGSRPVDQHLKALRAMGATVSEEPGGFYHAVRQQAFAGRCLFDLKTVGGTRNAMMAATLGSGTVVLENCALEPEVTDVADFLGSLGAKISGAGTPTITIEGVSKLRGGEYTVIPDRMEAGTYLFIAAASRGQLTLEHVNTNHMHAVMAKLSEIGIQVLDLDQTTLRLDARNAKLHAVNMQAVEYPGFPTDLQPQLGALLTTVPGTSILTDRIYPDRLGYSAELARMGGNLQQNNHTLVVQGGPLYGAQVAAKDIRAGGALVVAAAAAEGRSVITGTQFINRGYENLAIRLQQIGVRAQNGHGPQDQHNANAAD
jgi:UDP-N-acetylglucosamine 1-carboxyvinyltransferase